ncbi:MAG: hypothetical protein CMJ08_02160 [Pelagibacterales bacterium]|nr:hypothetical protein [Pelagibacterales bacterium]
MFDLKIINAIIIDGTGSSRFFGEIGINGNFIVERGKKLGASKSVYDANGHILCPGIIDTHTHYDAQITWDSSASPSLDLGVTTALIGNCGFTIAPCKPEHRDLNMLNLTKVEGMPYNTLKKGIDWSYETYSEYLNLLERKKLAINICSYIGHSATRIWSMGEAAMEREATDSEIIEMENIVKDAMNKGAIGFSTSTFEGHNGDKGRPMPSRLATNKEISRLIQAMAHNGRGLFMITKSNKTTIKDIQNIIGNIKRPAMIAALFYNPTKKDWAINILNDIEKSSQKGYEFWGQVSCRPLTMEFTMNEPYMLEGLSSWKKYMTESDSNNKIKILQDDNFRKKVRNEIYDTSNNKLFVGDWEKVKLIQAANLNNKKFEGMNIRDISVKEKKDPFDWLIDNALSKYGMNDLFIAELLNAENNEVKKLLLHDKSTVSLSDAGAHLSLLCDAGYGLDLLGKWSRDLNIISLEQAVFKLTGKQADICRIPKRGKLLPGYYADMLLFDPKKVGTSKSFRKNDLPGGSTRLLEKPLGVHGIWVNGTNFFQEQTPNGKLIRSYLP